MEAALGEDLDLFPSCFTNIRRLSSYDSCATRRTWIEAIGIPPQAWCRNNLRKIGELWGDMVCFDKAMELGDSFQYAKILVDILLLKRNYYYLWKRVISESTSKRFALLWSQTPANSSDPIVLPQVLMVSVAICS